MLYTQDPSETPPATRAETREERVARKVCDDVSTEGHVQYCTLVHSLQQQERKERQSDTLKEKVEECEYLL